MPNPSQTTVASRIEDVVRTMRCSGCGLCAQYEGVTMALDDGGYMRPVVAADSPTRTMAAPRELALFDGSCPGVAVEAQRPEGADRHPVIGPYAGIWAAHSTDPEARFNGSSGGVLTTIARFLVDTGRQSTVVGARADASDPSRTQTVQTGDAAEVTSLAGSRYAPVSNASAPEALRSSTVFIGKPCEAQAVRRMSTADGGEPPVILSFFCAGTPRQDATDGLLDELGAHRPLESMWYRGHGWPGSFTATGTDGEAVSVSYSDSWGAALGPTVQWRCRLCADGVGEYSDITAADYWESTPEGYPDFAEKEGVSALIARTRRGYEIVQEAVAAGVIEVEPLEPDALAAVQPYQVTRRQYLPARLAASRTMGVTPPRVRGFSLGRMAVRDPKGLWQQYRGSMSRLRRKFGVEPPWLRRRG